MRTFGIEELRSGDLPGYGSAYLKHIDEVNDTVKNLGGVKTALSASDLAEAEGLVRASAVLSDLTTLTLGGGKKLSLTLPTGGVRRARFPRAYLEKYKIDPANAQFHVGLAQPDDDEYKAFIRSCLPLIEQGRLLLRPPRLIMFKTDEHHWQALPVECDSGDDTWIVSGETQALGEVPVRAETESGIPLDLALPYLRGVTFSEFLKILDDAGDTILNLRRSIREALAQHPAADPKGAAQFRRDVIEPEVEALERTFKKAVASHKYTIGGAAIGIVGLSLSAIITGGATAVASGLLGAGGVGLVAKEYGAFRSKLEEMKEHPFYLFWRAKHQR